MKKIALFAIILLVFGCGEQVPPIEGDESDNDFTQTNHRDEQSNEENDTYSWSYSESIDEMTSSKNLFAQIISPKIVYFDFPYEGGSLMKLVVREMNGEEDVFLKISEGQFTTDYYDETITVRFDNNDPKKYSVSESSSGDSEYLFIGNESRFINDLKSSDSVKVKCMFYDHGAEVFTFYTKGFVWKE